MPSIDKVINMVIYSIVMFLVSALLIVMGTLIYRGNTKLIHDYHQENVKDKKSYGRAMGKSIIGISAPLILAGIVGFFTTSALPTVLLIFGLIISFIPVFITQKKYNGGMF